MKSIDTNPWLEEVRAAYAKSPAHQAIHGGKPVPGTIGAELPKEDRWESLAVDPLEAELADRMEG